MFIKKKTDWSLLAKYLAGETSEKEKEAIEHWAKEKPENMALLKEIKSDWNNMDKLNVRFDVDNAWDKLHNRIASVDTADTPVKAVERKRTLENRFSIPVRIAASLVLLAILGVAMVGIIGKLHTVQVMASVEEKGKTITLPDGSTLYLNANTTIKYARNFGKKQRDIFLKGEAFFEVTPDKTKPFRIYAGNACVKVLGTSFNVSTVKNKDQVEVYVSTGIVELSDAADSENKILLHPGNIGTISNRELKLTIAENKNSIAWKTGDLSFDSTPLSEVIPVLNAVYNVNIVVTEPGLDTTRIDGEYHGDPLDQILQIICTQNEENQLKVAKSADTIYLSR